VRVTTPRWRKVYRDLLAHKTRTVLVVLSIAVGIFAVAVMMGGRAILIRSLNSDFPATLPATVTYLTSDFDEALVRAVEREPDVAAAQGRRTVSLSYRREGGPWSNITLYAFEDYPSVSVNRLDPPSSGRWPERGEVLIETGSVAFSGLEKGDLIELETSGRKRPDLRVAGSVHDLNAALPTMTGRSFGYVSWDTLADLEEPAAFNQLDVRAARQLTTLGEASALGAYLRDEVIETQGVYVVQLLAQEPGVQAIADIFGAISLLLVLVGALTLVLSGFLVINTIGSLVAQQTRQLGVMKAIGARRGQLATMYFVMVLAYGALALLVAIPIGQYGTVKFADFGAGVLNFRIGEYTTPGPILAIQLAVGLLVPLAAASVPVLIGMRMPVREALYSSGTSGAQFGDTWFDRLLGRVRGPSRPIALALRNTFLRKGRLVLTLVTLTLAAGVFISVASVRSSIAFTVQRVGQHRTMDVWADVYPPQTSSAVTQAAMNVPGVVGLEGWIVRPAIRVRPDQSESPVVYLEGVPPDTKYFHPEIEAGRWLEPGDGNAIVIDSGFTRNDPDIKVGSLVTLKIRNTDETFRVVGLSRGDLLNQFAFVDLEYLDEQLNAGGLVDTLMIGTSEHDADSQAHVARQLTEAFADRQMRISNTITQRALQDMISDSLNLIVVFLVIMAALLTVVGGIGLSGTMSINVLESTREIGVMRAVGASNGSIYQIFIAEAVVVGLVSWVLGVAVSVPLSWALTSALGDALEFPLSYAFSFEGVLAWFAFVVVLSVLASMLPAYRAARVSVAEAIAYE
jgi:putative ABC transport system permease protein